MDGTNASVQQPAASTEEAADQEFEDAFAEFAAPKDDSEDADDEEADEEVEGDGAGDGANQTTEAETTQAAEGAAGTAAAGAGTTENKNTTVADGAAQGAAAAATTIDWSKADPTHRAAYEAAQAEIARLAKSDSSQRGRISAYNRVKDLSARLNRLGAADADGKAVTTEYQRYVASDSFKQFEKDYPEFAAPFKVLGETLTAQTARVADNVSALARETRHEIAAESGGYLYEQHPDYDQIVGVGDPNQAAKFGQWVAKMPRYVQEAVARNGKGVVDAEEVADVISRYKEAHKVSTQQVTQGTEQGREPAAGAGASSSQQQSPQNVLREARRQSGAAPQSRGTGTGSGAPADFDKAFDHFSTKKAKEIEAQRRHA